MLALEIKNSYIKSVFKDVEWELIKAKSTTESLKLTNKGLGTPTSNSSTKIIIRVILPGKKVGISIINNPRDWKECFLNAYKTAKVSTERETLPRVSAKTKLVKEDKSFKNYTEEDLFKSLEEIKNNIRDDICFLQSTVQKSTGVVEYSNSNDSNIKIEVDELTAVLGIGEGHRISEVGTSTKKEKLNLKGLVRNAVQHYDWSKNIVKPSNGEYPVLFAHDALRTVLNPITHSLLADNVIFKKSKFAGKMGELILDEKINLTDNPLHYNNRSYVDFEGNKTQKNKVVDKGVLKRFLHDSYTSTALKETNTFNSNNILIKPSVGFFNPEIKGKTDFNKMVKETSKGFIFYELYPEHTVNNITGAFGLNSINFYYIEKGEIQGVVKSGVITGNSFEIFKKVESISKQTRFDLGNYNLPVIKTKAEFLSG